LEILAVSNINNLVHKNAGGGDVVDGIAAVYGLEGLVILFKWAEIFLAVQSSTKAQPSFCTKCNKSFLWVKLP
jgi:hypothetical protein